MNVLVLNCGSSSIKYQLLNMDAVPVVLAKGIVEKIGLTYGSFTYKPEGKDKVVAEQPIMDHSVGMDLILKALVHPDHGVLKSLNEIDAVGHRVAHGGEYFSESVKIDDEAKAKIKALGEIAPLHNPANLKGIETMEKLLPSVPQVAVFDTSFHQTLPKKAFIYGIPYEYYEEYGVRRYGFHGTSHKFVAEKACRILGWDITEKKIITCHLGNGASITKKSGVQGISGVSSDFRELQAAMEKGNEKAALALDVFCYNVKKYIGAYAAVLNGVDLIIFTGGIGENDNLVRWETCKNMDYLGIQVDKQKNEVRGKDTIISTEQSTTTVMTVTTDEELVIAMDTVRLS